jgi:F0F1-type ATP synthase assembly protein I
MKRPERAEPQAEDPTDRPNSNANSSAGGAQKAFLVVGDGVLGAGLLIMIGAWGGNILDDRLHTNPWISLCSSLLLGGLGLARLIAKANELDTHSEKFSKRKSK